MQLTVRLHIRTLTIDRAALKGTGISRESLGAGVRDAMRGRIDADGRLRPTIATRIAEAIWSHPATGALRDTSQLYGRA